MAGISEGVLRAMIRAELPAEAFVPRPRRVLLAIPLVAVIIATSALLLVTHRPWYVTLAAWIVLSNAYVALMFFGHEVAHGAIVRSRPLQDLVLAASCAVFVVSPHLWRHWHNRMHHGHTNMPDVDPDRYDLIDDLEQKPRSVRWLTTRIAPGSGHWLSAFYLFIAFTAHAQSVLWSRSRRHSHPGFRWRRAVAETAVVALFWLTVSVAIGPRSAVDVVVLPMLLANAIVMSYITTNHMLRPLTSLPSALATSLSVRSPRLVDAVHLHFSHHTEHHLFPSISHRYYPLVRASLRRHLGSAYLEPAHWRALLTIYRTPRHYADPETLVNPLTGETVTLARVEDGLRDTGGQTAGAGV
jgi:fatty acid desaturase